MFCTINSSPLRHQVFKLTIIFSTNSVRCLSVFFVCLLFRSWLFFCCNLSSELKSSILFIRHFYTRLGRELAIIIILIQSQRVKGFWKGRVRRLFRKDLFICNFPQKQTSEQTASRSNPHISCINTHWISLPTPSTTALQKQKPTSFLLYLCTENKIEQILFLFVGQ